MPLVAIMNLTEEPNTKADEVETTKSNLDWRLPSSDDAKQMLLGLEWGSTVTGYLWYDLGDIEYLNEAAMIHVAAQFFRENEGRFGDIEVHRSSVIPGSPFILRLRGTLRLLRSVVINGRLCALYQFGHGDDASRVNFHEHWNSDAMPTPR